LAETGLLDQEADTIVGILVPSGTPQSIVAPLHGAIVGALGQTDATQKLAALGFEPIASTPDEFAARIATDIPKWANVIRAANIKAE